jgi:hypothetical protein
MRSFSASIVAALALASGSALAQPVLVLHSLIGGDLSADGNSAVGLLFDAQVEEYKVYSWQRGVGYTAIAGSGFSAEPIRASNDLSVLATGQLNTANWGNINCFNGYCFIEGDTCTLGDPLPPPSPCQIPYITHRWTSATGWTNLGSLPRTLDPVTNRFFGGTRCDSTVNSVGDVSGNGRYTVGGAWTSGLTRESGGPAYGLCGNLEAFIADAATGVISTLPVLPDNAGDSRADSINNDGTVITGYDFGPIESEFGPFDGRRICVWTNGVPTVIDGLSSSASTYPVNGAGTAIAGAPGQAFNTATFGIEDFNLVKWTRQPNDSWTPAALGRPIDFFDGVETKPLAGLLPVAVSDDGATIIGNASFGIFFFDRVSRPFIWRADINGGVPLDLNTYLEQLSPGSPVLQPGVTITGVTGLSADGNSIGVVLNDARSTCTPQDVGLAAGSAGVLYLQSAGITCSAPTIALPPRDNVSIQYTPFGVSLNVFASGTWPMTYTWQREDPANPGQWLELTEACAGFGFGSEWDYEGVAKPQLRIGQNNCGGGRDGRYRAVISNACGTITSLPAQVSFAQGTVINQQPVNGSACANEFGSVFAVAISSSSALSEQWEIASPSSPNNFAQLVEGVNTAPDGRALEIFGSNGQFLNIRPGAQAGSSTYLLRCVFTSPCGNATSDAVTFTVAGPTCTGPQCDDIDFNNNDVFPEDQDVVDFFEVLAGGDCSTFFCNDIDFNNNFVFPEDQDVIDFFNVLAGGTCP